MSSTQEVGQIFGEGTGPAQAMLRSPTVLIVSIGLWGMNIFFFRLFGIDYRYVLNFDLLMEKEGPKSRTKVPGGANETVLSDDDDEESNSHDGPQDEWSGGTITWQRLVVFSLTLLVLLHITTHLWIDRLGRGSVGAVMFFYSAVLLYVILPFPSTRWLRTAFGIVFARAFELVKPRCSCLCSDPAGPRPIPFVDVFFADAMCSLSKVFFDWGMLFHMASHYPEPVPPSAHNILIPSAFAAVPYLIRARQCLIMHTVGRIKNDPKRSQHLANALKYSTSIFPLCLSAYQKTIEPSRAANLEHLLLLLLVINALYALYWDIVMDWGMMQSPTAVVQVACTGGAYPIEGVASPPKFHHILMRPRLRYGFMLSMLIMVGDAILRFSWLLRFVKLFPNDDSFVLLTQFLEVFRRAIWNLLRVEWENIKQQNKTGRHGKKPIDGSLSVELQPLKEGEIERAPPSMSARIQLGAKVATA